MKKRGIALLTLLALCMALVLSVLPIGVFAAETTEAALVGTKLTTSHAGKTLSGDYYVEPGTTLTLRGGTGVSGLKVASGSTLTIHIPANSVLYVYGGAASGTTGAGAGIEVVSGTTLKITGAGKLYAYGGKAANGSNGAKGENANWVDDGKSYIPDGGYGGNGGGGAGAGIGTKGGNGGSGTSWTRGFYGGLSQTSDNFKDANYSGPNGANGGSGSSASACGAIYISADVTYSASGGAAGTSGGSGGSKGSSDTESDDGWKRGIAGGAGGGGGGSGKAGANIGTGGGGGGGGGAGGGVGYAWSYRYLGGGGGGGGAGAVGGGGGTWGPDGEIPDCKKFQYFGGVERYSGSGSSGGTTSGGSGGQGAKVMITNWAGTSWQYPYGGYGGKGGSAGSNCQSATVQRLYDVTISVEDELIGSYLASADNFLPASIEIPVKVGYTFEGFYAGDVQYYDANGVRTSEKITADTDIAAKFTVNSYDYGVESSDGSTGGGSNLSGSLNYGDSITLTTPQREGYLFRGWKISATDGTINENAYYTYSPMATFMRTSSNANQVNAQFIHTNGSAMTAGFEQIGESVTLYNLSADKNARIKIEEVWVRDSFTVTFKDFDGTVIGTPQTGRYGTDVIIPALPENQNDYYVYTFKYWKCNIDNQYYTTDQIHFLGEFLEYEATYGDKVYEDVTFTAVYEITEYKKELHLVGSLGNTNLEDGKLILNSGDTNVKVITNFKLTINDGVAALLLLPQYDSAAFSIQAISVNGQLVYGTGATSSTVLNGFDVSITGNETQNNALKILLDNITPDASTNEEDVFIQVIYVMRSAIGGEYKFGFVTATPTDTDHITHGDRSEAYGTYDPDASSDTDAYRFNELKITVDSTAIKVVIRATGSIEIDQKQSFVYNGQEMSAADTSQLIANVLQYTYNGFAKKNDDTLTIKWYDAQGNLLSEAPKNVGTYMIGISAAETTYYTEVEEVKVAFTITSYTVYVTAGDQNFEYSGSDIVINNAASNGGIFLKDAEGNLIPVDAFVNSELELIGVELLNNRINVGTYTDEIAGVINFIGNGSAENYTIVYENGTLIITKAENDWVIVPSDKTAEYSGSEIPVSGGSAEFGDVKVEYLIDYEKDSEGNYVLDENEERIPIWSETPPVNAGTYPVRITVTGNENYSDLSCEVMLTITKKVISADGFTFEAIDKIYNGESQYWSLDPNEDENTGDAEVKLIASDENALILQYVKFAGMAHPVDCKNAGTYMIQAVLVISNPNYTFRQWNEKTETWEDVDSWTYDDVEVEILKRKINVSVDDQSAEYSGSEPTVNQGEGYVTITLENGTAAPDFIIRDFFGGIREIYIPAVDYVENVVYYELIDGEYKAVELTKEAFDANKVLAGEEGEESTEEHKEYYTKITIYPEILTLVKDAGVVAGEYALTAILETPGSNYELVGVDNGIFTITKKLIPVPELGILIYNGQEQCPEVPEEYQGIYQFVGNGKDVGIHLLTAVLVDKDNYAWENVVSIDVTALPTNKNFTVQIADRLLILYLNDISDYETINFVISAGTYSYSVIPSTSDDIVLPWYIDQKTIILVYPDATKEYVYGTFVNDILNELGDPCWKDGVGPYAGDTYTDIHWLNVGYDHAYPEVGTKGLSVSQGMFNTNYKVLIEGGVVTITKKILTQDELEDEISAAIKYYTGEVLVLDTWDDFKISLLDYNSSYQNVFYVTTVNTNGHVKANGLMNGDVFDYHVDEDTGKIYVTVTVALTEEVKENYELAGEAESFTFDVEAYIAKADNKWTSGPAVDSTNIEKVITSADALFGDLNEVEFFTDEACTKKVSVNDLDANTTYYAKFTVTDTDDYYGLEAIIVFSGNHITVIKPVVTLDGTVVSSLVTEIIYDGLSHSFVVPTGDGYTVIFDPEGTWKNAGTYTVKVVLKDNHAWEDGSLGALTYTLNINKKAVIITAKDTEVQYGFTPYYSVLESGFVTGESVDTIFPDGITFVCDYTVTSPIGSTHAISFPAEYQTMEFTNYTVTFENGTLTVIKRYFNPGNLNGGDNNGTIIRPLPNLQVNGLTLVYNGLNRSFIVENVPDGVTVSFKYWVGANEVTPNAAGEYTVELIWSSDIYDVTNAPQQVTLKIEPAKVTISVSNQTYDYDGSNQAPKVPDFVNGYTFEFTNVTDTDTDALGDLVTGLTVNGTYVNAGVYTDAISVAHGYDSNYVVTIEKGDLIILKVNNVWTKDLDVEEDIVYDKESIESGVDFFSDPKFGDETIKYIFFYKDVNGEWVELGGAPTQAGEYAVVASVPETNNYNELVSERITFRIRKAVVTLNGVVFENGTFIYNGKAHSIDVTTNEASSLFTISYEGNEQINAGTYTVTATFVLVDDRNYMFDDTATKTAELTINAVKVTINANNKESMFGELLQDLTYDIAFDGADGDDGFYVTDFGSVVLNTTATSQSNVGDYAITVGYTSNSNYDVTVKDGVYTISKFMNNVIDLKASDVHYLMDLIYSATSLRGQDTIVFTFATSENGTYTSELPKNVGTYYVKATIADHDNYNGVSATVKFNIDKATLSSITDIAYNADTATWTAVVTTTDGKQIDCDVTYLVNGNKLTAPSFTATNTGSFTVVAVPADEHNYNNSAEITLATVYSVTFADKVENHEKQSALADLSAAVFATQYRFESQAVTRPDSTPVIVGYTFRAWQLDGADYGFAEGVTSDITLYAAWTINSYTLYFYNEVVTGSGIVNGVFQEGVVSEELLTTYTVTYGSPFNLTGVTIPTKDADAVYTYVFAYWADALRGNELNSTIYVYDNMDLYAVYNSIAKQFTITYMVSIDGGEYKQHGEAITLPYGSALVSLGDVAWFIGDAWYTDSARQNQAPAFVPAENMTLYGAYVFDIGAGDVNADGKVNTDDIVNYRRWVVGGYNIVTIEEGTEWSWVTSGNYNANTVYYLVRVSDANRDDSGDIRDITTIRMALTGGYGYDYVSGRDSAAGVTGEGVVISGLYISSVSTTEAFKEALENGGFIQLTEDISFSEVVTIDKDTVIYLNGHTLDMSGNTSRPFDMASNARLVIYGEGATVKTGNYGLVRIPDSAKNSSVDIYGGTYEANTDDGSFIRLADYSSMDVSIVVDGIKLVDVSEKGKFIVGDCIGGHVSLSITNCDITAAKGIVIDSPSKDIYISNSKFTCTYQGLSVGGFADEDPSKFSHVTIEDCEITVNSENGVVSGEKACLVVGYGGKISISNSVLSSDTDYIAGICSYPEYSGITITDCTINHNSELPEFYEVDGSEVEVIITEKN